MSPDEIGRVIETTSGGSRDISSDAPFKRVAILASDTTPETVAVRLEDRLRAAGFRRRGLTGWIRSRDGHTVRCYVTVLGPGETLQSRHAVVVPSGSVGVALRFVAG